jgi:hypothetical protein
MPYFLRNCAGVMPPLAGSNCFAIRLRLLLRGEGVSSGICSVKAKDGPRWCRYPQICKPSPVANIPFPREGVSK